MLELGVKHFCWLHPGEEFHDPNFSDAIQHGDLWPHGAFAYFYDDHQTELDCFHHIVTPVVSSQSAEAASGPSKSLSQWFRAENPSPIEKTPAAKVVQDTVQFLDKMSHEASSKPRHLMSASERYMRSQVIEGQLARALYSTANLYRLHCCCL